jgi:ketosteroid isomerase-like protein
MKVHRIVGNAAAKLSVLSFLGCAVLLGLTACNTAPPPAPDTRAADEAAVRKADALWVNAAKSRNVDDWVAFYADDAVILPPNEKTASGKDSIRKVIGEMFAVPNVVIAWEPTKIEVAKSGDLAYLYGTYQMSWDDASGKSVTDNGKMVEIWKKQADGNWKCIVDTWSSDLPPAPAAPAAK